MCGICGIFNFDNKKPDKRLVESMCAALVHRGPDDQGIYITEGIGLGFRRLSIIDIETGKQPMSNEDETIWIVCNGEIYNFLELRDFLSKKGHTFKTKSDIEVILHLYEEEGEMCVTKLRGMFAYAIWDGKRKKLILARDRIGIKPLFYACDNHRVIFGSEINTILQDTSFNREMDFSAFHEYLNYFYVPAPLSIFKGLHKVLPGHIIVLQNGKKKETKYWDLQFRPVYQSEKYLIEKLHNLLEETVQMHLVSDVPLGAFLSGGIDSSTIVAYMSAVMRKPVETFSIGFENEDFNELPYASMVAERFRTNHHEYINVQMKEDVDFINKLLMYFGEPFADSSSIPTYHVSRIARENCTVALSGDGGDETFGGYAYRTSTASHYYQKLPKVLKNAGSILSNMLFGNWGKRFGNIHSYSVMSPVQKHLEYHRVFNEMEKRCLLNREIYDTERDFDYTTFLEEHFSEKNINDPVNQMLYLDTMYNLPNDMLVKVDRMSMAHSLEVRVPFLDHKLLEFAATLHGRVKQKGFSTLGRKYILRKTLSRSLPKAVINRKKMGFSIPLTIWLKRNRPLLYDIFSEENVRREGYFNYGCVQQMLKELDKQQNPASMENSTKVWTLLIFELWRRMFLEAQ